MCDWGNSIVLGVPDHLNVGRDKRNIAVDECIAKTISHLWWTHRVETLSSCCGHGEGPPSLILPNYYTDNQIRQVYKYIEEVDDREWHIAQWRPALKHIPKDGSPAKIIPTI